MDKTGEESATDYEIARGVKLKQQHFTSAKSLKWCLGRWAPEIYLIHLRLGRMQLKPFVIGDRNEEIHRATLSKTALRWKSRNCRLPAVKFPTLIRRSVSMPILRKEGLCATGEMMRFPESSN